MSYTPPHGKQDNSGDLPNLTELPGFGKEGQNTDRIQFGQVGTDRIQFGQVGSLELDDIIFILKNNYIKASTSYQGNARVIKRFLDMGKRELLRQDVLYDNSINSCRQRIVDCVKTGLLASRTDRSKIFYSLTDSIINDLQEFSKAREEGIGAQRSNGGTLSQDIAVDNFKKIMRSYYGKETSDLQRSFPDKDTLEMDFDDIGKVSPALEDFLVTSPIAALHAGNQAINELLVDSTNPSEYYNLSIFNLPDDYQRQISGLYSEDLHKLRQIRGIVEIEGEANYVIEIGAFECQRCGQVMRIPQARGESLKEPYLCEGCEKKGPFKHLADESKISDSRYFMIEEDPSDLKGDSQPAQILVELKGRLARMNLAAGENVVMVGVTYSEPIKNGKKGPSRYTKIFLPNYIEKTGDFLSPATLTDQDKNEIEQLVKSPDYEKDFIDSIAPHIYGMDHIKQAVILQQFGSPTLRRPGGTPRRGWINILLVGNPATAKSQILTHVKRNTPRARYVEGGGASRAGLVASADRDDKIIGGFTIRAGAIAKAHGSTVTIDEFDKLGIKGQEGLHEPAELGTVSINKAGRTRTFKSETSILAAANPEHGRFDEFKPWLEQVNISPPLLSRFDLMFKVIENPEDYGKISERILTEHNGKGISDQKIPREVIQKTVLLGKTIRPRLPSKVKDAINEFYLGMKENPENNITVRSLEALIRLTLARSRMFLRDTANLSDFELAKKLFLRYLKDFGMNSQGNYDTSFIEGETPSKYLKSTEKILDIIREISSKKDKPATLKDFKQRLKTEDLDEDDLKDLLRLMKNRRLIAQSKDGWIEV